MSELNNRVNAQREILRIINEKAWYKEPLIALSHKAIDRWANKNNISQDSELVSSIYEVSEKLFALANKSQEQITEEYLKLSAKINEMKLDIKNKLNKY